MDRACRNTEHLRQPVRQRYGKSLSTLERFYLKPGFRLDSPWQVGQTITLFNWCFLDGLQPNVGETTLAAWMNADPRYSKIGDINIPGAWRCSRGRIRFAGALIQLKRSLMSEPRKQIKYQYCQGYWKNTLLEHQQASRTKENLMRTTRPERGFSAHSAAWALSQ